MKRDTAHVAIFAPAAGDAALLRALLDGEGVAWQDCAAAADLYAALGDHALAAVVTEEGLAQCSPEALDAALGRQSPWSDVPLLVLAAVGAVDTDRFARLAGIGNVTLLARPTTRQALLMAIRSALRTRRLQFALRDRLEELGSQAGVLEQAVAERTASLEREVQERRRVEQALAEARRLESLGRLTGGVAHDFNNILQVISGGETLVRMLLDKDAQTRVGRALDGIRRASDHGAALTQQLLAYARRQPLATIVLDLRAHLRATAELLLRTLGAERRLRTRVAPDTWPVLADPTQLDAALLNIAGNARDAMPRGGMLELAVRNWTLPDPALPEAGHLAGDFVCVCLTDDGEGMSEEVARQAFEPFFTTKPVGKGTGLGLSQVYGFAIQSQGFAYIRRERVGTTVGILLPRSSAPTGAAAAPEQGGTASLDGMRILCVEDDAEVAETTAALLQGLGARVSVAASADAAVEADLAAFDVVLSDVMMPGFMDGIDLARWLAQHRPGLPVVLVSGYMVEPERLQSLDVQLVRKPFALDALAGTLRAAADGRDARRER
ncbi:response regulator [Massilia sp. YIM B02763]|uniref:response regulator n=1 Tax=Massilia sp. YIM B02763 TaxID=3050130 RepID=UPI0025B6A2C5|nr:response regulator [Massilia sp. YIM B02763]MDN4052780.1 response regulator [Massilia sp. YIM B02763]